MSDAENQVRLQELARQTEFLNTVFGPAPSLDPRWEWINVSTVGGRPEYVKGACRHLTPIEVRSVVTNDLLAHLCPDCDTQLPA